MMLGRFEIKVYLVSSINIFMTNTPVNINVNAGCECPQVRQLFTHEFFISFNVVLAV